MPKKSKRQRRTAGMVQGVGSVVTAPRYYKVTPEARAEVEQARRATEGGAGGQVGGRGEAMTEQQMRTGGA